MGFYGNITNTSRTQFQFDKIYPNRYEMDRNAQTDGVYLGRYVLIEYDNNYHLDTFKRVFFVGNVAYLYNASQIPDERYKLTKSQISQNELVYTSNSNLTVETGLKGNECIFYKCTSAYIANSKEAATFEAISRLEGPAYTDNYNIDKEHYNPGRGYDSTVWQKVFSKDSDQENSLKEHYVMIAELNTVVPTFDVVAEAPTMNPVVPHFDTESTDVYYKLHWQTPWGFRVAEAKNTSKSDVKTNWTEIEYDPNTGTNITKNLGEKNAAIYFNRAAFDSQVGKASIKKKDSGINEIKVTPASSGKKLYDDHNPGTKDPIAADDIQEMSINLPAIGNMMSDAWDIIHGPNRDNARTDKNSSLQGRLDSFKDMNVNAIPVKRAADGTLVSSYINGNTSKNVTNILTETLSESFDSDDAWIKTSINTIGLDNENDLSGIAIHHTFHSVEDTNTTSNINGNGDTIKLYTPKVDAAGHVVGKNIETVTLPFGYKTIKTNGRSNEVTENATGTPTTANIVADSTQDTLTINSGNKWIRIDTNASGDSLTIRHDVHNTTNDSKTTDWTKTEENTTIPVATYSYDEAGHYVSHHIENYKLPFGYGKIKGDAGSTAATATYDELSFASDKWLTATITQDKVIYSHDYPEKIDDTENESDVNGNGDTIVLETLVRDEKGHVIKVNQNTVTLPYGYKTFKDSEATPGQSNANNTQDVFAFKGDSWIKPVVTEDLLTLTHEGPSIVTATKVDDATPNFGGTFIITDWYFDNRGHKSSSNTHTVKIPLPSLTNGSGNVVTGLSLTPSTGAFVETKNNISNLLLTNYSKKTDNTDIADTDALGDALSKLQTQIREEENKRAKDINDEVTARAAADTKLREDLDKEILRAGAAEEKVLSDAKAYSDAIKKSILTGESSEELKDTYDTLVEIQKWIEDHGVEAADLTEAIAAESNRAISEETKLQENINTIQSNLSTAINNESNRAMTAEENLNTAIIAESTTRANAIGAIRTELQAYTDSAINTLGSAAHRDEDEFILKSKYDEDMQVQEARIIGLNTEAKRLTNEVIALTERITALENLINQLT